MIRNRVLILLFAFITIFIGCKPKKKTIISGFWMGKNWDVYRISRLSFKIPRYCYYFSRNGKCIYYQYYLNNEGKISKAVFDPNGDVQYPEVWNLKNDSTINIRGFDYKFLLLSEKEIVLVNKLSLTDTIELRASSK